MSEEKKEKQFKDMEPKKDAKGGGPGIHHSNPANPQGGHGPSHAQGGHGPSHAQGHGGPKGAN